jgi:hypothetical protein
VHITPTLVLSTDCLLTTCGFTPLTLEQASGSPTGTINFSTRSAFYFTAIRRPNVRATEDTDCTTWQPFTTISTLFGTYASGTTAEVMHTFLHRAFFQAKSPKTNHAGEGVGGQVPGRRVEPLCEQGCGRWEMQPFRRAAAAVPASNATT